MHGVVVVIDSQSWQSVESGSLIKRVKQYNRSIFVVPSKLDVTASSVKKEGEEKFKARVAHELLEDRSLACNVYLISGLLALGAVRTIEILESNMEAPSIQELFNYDWSELFFTSIGGADFQTDLEEKWRDRHEDTLEMLFKKCSDRYQSSNLGRFLKEVVAMHLLRAAPKRLLAAILELKTATTGLLTDVDRQTKGFSQTQAEERKARETASAQAEKLLNELESVKQEMEALVPATLNATKLELMEKINSIFTQQHRTFKEKLENGGDSKKEIRNTIATSVSFGSSYC